MSLCVEDDLYNLLELAYHLTGTIWKIDIYPDLACVLGIEDLLLELNNTLATNQGTVLQYDTTFNLGDFYVSPLVCRHSIFDKSPTIPVTFLIHDKKYSDVHEMFLNVLKTKIPNLSRQKFTVAIDRETGIHKDFENVFPQCNILHCWNHIKRDIRYWLNKHGARKDEIGVYIQDVIRIMQTDCIDALQQKFAELSNKWSKAMVDCFEDNLRCSIEQHAAQFVLEPLSLYDLYSGVTTNASESMNALIKDLIAWKERPVDVIVLTLFLPVTKLFPC